MKTISVIFIFILCSCKSDKKTDDTNSSIQENISVQKVTISSNASLSSNQIPFIIIPGQGIDNIKLGISNDSDILNFKNLQFTIHSGKGIACGNAVSYNYFWKRISNEKSGLLFEYSSEYFPENNIPKIYELRLDKITIQDNKSAKLLNGIQIGASTYLEVAKAFGPLDKDWKNESYIRFAKKGISFTFDDSLKLSTVVIFKPHK